LRAVAKHSPALAQVSDNFFCKRVFCFYKISYVKTDGVGVHDTAKTNYISNEHSKN